MPSRVGEEEQNELERGQKKGLGDVAASICVVMQIGWNRAGGAPDTGAHCVCIGRLRSWGITFFYD